MAHDARTEAADPVERALTADGAAVRLRDKHVARVAAAVMVPAMLLALLATVAVALGADPAAPRVAALIPFGVFVAMAYSALANMVVRTALTDGELRVQWGLRRITVPLAAITRCEARGRPGGPTAATGAGWALFADRGAVHIAWSDAGRERAVLLPANDPTALAAAIDEARSARSGVRVDAEAAPVEALAEAPAAAATGDRAAR